MSDIHLYIYDLSLGLAKKLSSKILDRKIEGIWHTAIVAFNEEWWYALNGLNCCTPQKTLLKRPQEIVHLGKTELNIDEFHEIIQKQKETGNYKVGAYNLFKHNCNNFANELAQTLVGQSIPDYILNLPNEAIQNLLDSNIFGPVMRQLIERSIAPTQNESDEIEIPDNLNEKVFEIIKEHFVTNKIRYILSKKLNEDASTSYLKCIINHK